MFQFISRDAKLKKTNHWRIWIKFFAETLSFRRIYRVYTKMSTYSVLFNICTYNAFAQYSHPLHSEGASREILTRTARFVGQYLNFTISVSQRQYICHLRMTMRTDHMWTMISLLVFGISFVYRHRSSTGRACSILMYERWHRTL